MKEKLNEIIESLSELDQEGGENAGSLLLHGNLINDEVVAVIKGNPTVLAMAFGNQMRTNPKFNQVLISMFAAFLIEHPDQKDAFIRTLENTPMAPSVN